MGLSSSIVDDKGRITIPEDVRKKLGIRKGSKVRVSLKKDKAVVVSAVDGKMFIDRMEGFIKKGSKVEKIDPIKLKEIWTAR